MRVSIGPGQTALTRTPAPDTSPAVTLVRPITACLEATWARHAGRTDQPCDRCAVDYCAGPLFEHDRQDVPQPQKHPLDVDRHHAVEDVLVILCCRRNLAFYSGVVEKAVDSVVFARAAAT
ncbi:MAG: hypothetical protein Ct9H300mP16_11030 [Pseudomonadota bacterium]|nr:MAG: hypothetical protein Ct9H300mP16_11030 [Pseudomonadota bacterium]